MKTPKQLHAEATKILIDRVIQKLGLETVEDFFDVACMNENRTASEAWEAFVYYEREGITAPWAFNFALDLVAGRLPVS